MPPKKRATATKATPPTYQRAYGRLCLNMIVKNEAHVIKRCLDNVGHLVDAIAIVDTGSTDKTVSIIEEWATAHKIPSEVIVDPWRDDFGYSRTVALRHGEKVVEKILAKQLPHSPECGTRDLWYLMFMDADNLCFDLDGVGPFKIKKDKLGADAYMANIRGGTIDYGYNWLVRVNPDKQWQWYGPRHEYISPIKDKEKKNTWSAIYATIEGGYIDSRREGARSMDPRKYLRDAIAFERALLEDPDDDRYLYYLAQSYNDASKMIAAQAQETKKKAEQLREEANTTENKNRAKTLLDQAKEATKKYEGQIQYSAILLERAEKAYVYRGLMFKDWTDEYTYLAWLEAAKIRHRRHGQYDKKTLIYLGNAMQKNTHRLEAVHYLVENHLERKSFLEGWILAKDYINLPFPDKDTIFVDTAIHRYLFIFNASLCAYYAGSYAKFVELSKRVVDNAYAPDNIKDAAKNNLANFGPKAT